MKKSIPNENDEWWKRNYQNRLLIFGILLSVLGIYEFQDSFAIKSRLKELKGTIKSADTYTETHTDKYGHSSQTCELIFYLNGHKKKFYLVHTIGDEFYDSEYEGILNKLRRANVVSVWVRPKDINDYQPKIFQITTDTDVILDFDNVRTEHSLVIIFVIFLGLGSIIIYILLRFYKEFPKE